jgi:1-acyl-sn-glycerol-3-phosphate acyltransferase
LSYAGLRLASLWLSQTARVLADWCLRMAVFAALLQEGVRAGWHMTTAIFIAPFIVLAPLNGLLGNSLPRRAVLVGAAAFTLLSIVARPAFGVPWLVCLGLVAIGSAVYSPVRSALLPAAAADCRVPLPRVSGWIEIGGAGAIVLGALLGVRTPHESLTGMLLVLNVICLIAALPVAFPSDVIRPEPVTTALVGFFRDCLRIGRDRVARRSLVALASFQAVVTAGSGVLLTLVLLNESFTLADLFRPLLLMGVGAALGCATASIEGHPRRCLGLVPLGLTGLLVALAWAALAGGVPAMPCFLLGFMGGLVNVPLRATYLAYAPPDARGNASAAMNMAIYVATVALALALVGLVEAGLLTTPATQLAVLTVLTAAGVVVAWRTLYPQAMEVGVEIALLPIYRVRAHGPGANGFPMRGPLLIVANHSAYLDPFWLAKVVPRQVRPMMTSAFYDLPIVNWLSRNVARAIRVPVGVFRREAPELQQAMSVLRAGECLVIFPEGMLRRADDELLRPFGRGVWHVLHELPATPVCVCWIEGGWGSYFSYKNGPPGKNKPVDRHRPIDIAISEPQPLAAAVLADHHTTRRWLQQAVLDCRSHLGLAAPQSTERAEELGDGSDEETAREESSSSKPLEN